MEVWILHSSIKFAEHDKDNKVWSRVIEIDVNEMTNAININNS